MTKTKTNPNTAPKRLCCKCKLPIGHGDKFKFIKRPKVAHRNCKNPKSYYDENGECNLPTSQRYNICQKCGDNRDIHLC